MNFPMKYFMVDSNPRVFGAAGMLKGLALPGWMLSVLLCCVTGAFAQSGEDLFKLEPGYVHDYAGWLSASEKNALEEKLRRYDDSTTTQVVVVIRPDIGDYDKASYAFELGNRLGIGRKSKNNGVVMFIKSEPPDRGIFIATGYGTEGALPDITAGQIIRNTMAPYFRQKQYYAGIEAGLDDIIRALAGEFKAEPGDREPKGGGWIFLIIFAIVVLLFIFIIAKAAKKGTIYTSAGPGQRRGGDWWIGGGGFGGGSSGGWGGGGDSGGGFGGFGGGSFGGGGAGGDW